MIEVRRMTWALLPLMAGCASTPGPEQQAAMAAEARKASGELVQKLGAELRSVLGEKGAAEAISVCKERAPKIAADISKASGWQVKRASPKNRNPAGVPDAWEARAQAALEKRLAAGDKAEILEVWEVVDTPQGRTFRYARALPVQPLCLACHGDPAQIADAVKAKLASEYPQDKATGYAPGMIRGIVSVQRPL